MRAYVVALFGFILMCQQPQNVPGGYTRQDAGADIVVDAKMYLATKLANTNPSLTLGDTLEAYTQVVAGHNVLLICEYRNDKTSHEGTLRAEVYIDARERHDLTSLKLDP